MLNVTSLDVYIACCEAIKDSDLSNTTHLINKPTLVIVGSDDKSTTPILVESTAKLIENSSFKVIYLLLLIISFKIDIKTNLWENYI
mgnify:CR=1 FL=1